ncbi:hypothetical protein HYV80_00625 [Candidatus Woesearchaeota archaeon]|nr:hypothetical protein [Candidatus Woesearchaeota archaeon]
MRITPFQKGDDIVAYASGLTHQLFKGVTRANGLPYTQEHLAKVAASAEKVLLPSRYKESGVATGWLHDAGEDISEIDVFNPYNPRPKTSGAVTLNDILEEAGKEGEYLCYMVNLLTHREGMPYFDYINNIFSFPEEGIQRNLSIIAGVLKVADRRNNTNPNERSNVDKLVTEYLGLKDASQAELMGFYKRTKTFVAFKQCGDFSVNVALFVETLLDSFKAKQQAMAIDNLAFYLPLAERRLLVDVGDKNGLFDWGKVRNLLKEAYADSLRLYPGADALYVVDRLGVNRKAPPIPGYKPILEEVREGLVHVR